MDISALKKVNKKIILYAIAILIAIIIIPKFFHKNPEKKATPVKVAAVIAGSIAPNFDAVGTITTENNVDIKSQVNGQITSIPVNPGQEVQQNQLLFVIDPKPFQAQVDQAKANLEKDQAAARNANAELARYKKLVHQGYISKEFFDQITSNAETANAVIDADQAALTSATLQLSYTQIRAPISGRLSDIAPDPGDLVTANNTTPLATINQFKPIDAQFSLPSKDLPAILNIPKMDSILVTATPDADKSMKATGKLNFINNQIDQTTGTITMRAIFTNDDEKLWPGEFVQLHITLPNNDHAVLAPTIALQQDQHQQYYAYTIDEHNIAHLRHVTIGITQGKNTSILSGLQIGEKVITKGQFEIGDGSLVAPDKIG